MRRVFIILSFSSLCFISCNPGHNTSVKYLENIYQEKFKLYSTDDTSAKSGKTIKLICTDNSLVEDGSLLPEALANNCAVVLFLTNKKLFETNSILDVEITADKIEALLFQYRASFLDSLTTDYLLADTAIKYFIATARSNDPMKAKSIGYNADLQPEQNFVSFMNEFREQILPGYNNPQIVGYTFAKKGKEVSYSADVVLPSIDNFKKWMNISLVKTNNEMKIKEVNF